MFPKSLENLHHATIITGNRVANLVSAKDFIQNQGVETVGNPDVMIFDDDQLGVDEARQIVSFVSSKKVSSARFIILSFDRATSEAQNALLKSIEEPQEGTYFFILVPKSELLLPTILSRAQNAFGILRPGDTRLSVPEFLKSNLSGRFALVEQWTKNKKEEDNLTKTEVINFLDQIEKNLWENKNRDEQIFTDIRQMRQYADIRGASHRVILDFIGMIVPILK